MAAFGWKAKIRDSNFVLMVCTETYYRRAVGQEESGKGLGVRWEGRLITILFTERR